MHSEIQGPSPCDWGEIQVLGLKGNPFLSPCLLKEVDSSAVERERIEFEGLAFNQGTEARGLG